MSPTELPEPARGWKIEAEDMSKRSPVIEGDKIGMIHQLRIYEIFEQNKEAFHNRFRDHASRIMRSYGFNILGTWETKTGDRTEFVYLLAWPDEQSMRHAWQEFKSNEEWKQIKKMTNEKHGELVGEIQDRTLTITSYSPSILQTKLP